MNHLPNLKAADEARLPPGRLADLEVVFATYVQVHRALNPDNPMPAELVIPRASPTHGHYR